MFEGDLDLVDEDRLVRNRDDGLDDAFEFGEGDDKTAELMGSFYREGDTRTMDKSGFAIYEDNTKTGGFEIYDENKTQDKSMTFGIYDENKTQDKSITFGIYDENKTATATVDKITFGIYDENLTEENKSAGSTGGFEVYDDNKTDDDMFDFGKEKRLSLKFDLDEDDDLPPKGATTELTASMKDVSIGGITDLVLDFSADLNFDVGSPVSSRGLPR